MLRIPQFFALGLVGALAVGGPVGDSAQPSDMDVVGPAVSGAGQIRAEGSFRTFAFHAVNEADGSVSGTFQLVSRDGRGRDRSMLVVHGTVTCVTVRNNAAWIGGVIEQVQDTQGRELEGLEVGWRVVDRGSRRNQPDQLSLAQVGNPGWARNYCRRLPGTPMFNTTSGGNITVH